jgi:tetratricopeptide (TPR) repeat protein
MEPELLKAINSLLTINSKGSLLLQLILVGNDDLQKILNQSLSEKAERLWHHIKPLTALETNNYILHRLKIAGTTEENLFNKEVSTAIYEYSKGVPKKINSLCHRLLLFSSTNQINRISPAQIQQITEDKKPKIMLVPPLVPVADDAPRPSLLLFKQGWKTGLVIAGIGLTLSYLLSPFLREPKEPQITAYKKPDSNEQNTVVATVPRTSAIETKVVEKTLNPKVASLNRHKNSISYNKKQISKSYGGTVKDEKIEQLLAVAEHQLSESKLLTPTKDNAYETYNSILSTNSHDKRALSGLQKIADRYLVLAKNKFNQEELLQSKVYIARGLKALSGHQDLVALNKQIDTKLNDLEQGQQQIQTLVKQGNQQIAELKFISPIGDNGYQSFMEILAVDKSNQQAKQGMEKIQHMLNSQMQDALDKERYNSAQVIAKQVLSISDNENYLEDTVATAHHTEKFIQVRVTTLLAHAEQQLNSKQIFYPAGNNAIETYRKILRIDQTHPVAKKGIEKIVKQYQVLANEALANNENRKALIYADEAVKAFPNNYNLLKLQSKISLSEQKAEQPSSDSVVSYNKHTELKKQLRPFGNF